MGGRRSAIQWFGPAKEAGYVWIYLIGIENDFVKAGATRNPKARISDHRRTLGVFKWVHFAGKVKESHWTVMESAVIRALEVRGDRINFSEVFRGVDKRTAIEAAREAMQSMRDRHCNDSNKMYGFRDKSTLAKVIQLSSRKTA